MIPYFFSKGPLPDELSSVFSELVNDLNDLSSKDEALKEVYKIISLRFRASRLKVILRSRRIFLKDPEIMWKKNFLYCHQMNYLLRLLLVKSRWFEDDDIKLKYSLVYYFMPHQYLKIRISDNQYMNVDPWGRSFGVKLGDYLYGFHG